MERLTLKLDIGKVAYVAEGRGPALILMHSLGFSADTWIKVLKPLAQHYTVYALDMLGHGYSDKPPKNYLMEDYAQSVVAFMEKLGLQKAFVCGNSIGAMIALEMAATYPQRVERLILIGCAIRDAWQRMERLALFALACDPEGKPMPFSVSAPPVPSLGFIEETPELLEWINQQWARAGVWVMKASIAAALFDAFPRLPLVKCPTLIMYGTRDFVRESGKVFLKGIKGSKQALIENAGHIAQMDQPEAFVREVDQFLGSSSKSSGKS